MSSQIWHHPPVRRAWQPWLTDLGQVPHKHQMPMLALRALAALPLRAYLRTYHRLHIVGRENLPNSGSFIMVANHASHLDALCLLSAIPLLHLDRAFPVAAHDYFFAKQRRMALAARFTNAIPFSRQIHLRRSLQLCRHLLAVPGNVLILFPEGTRTTSGHLGEFRPGIGSLLAGTQVPVVPCAIHGSFRAWPKGDWFPRPHGLRLVIGKPRHFADLPRGRESSNHIASQLHAAVRDCLCE